MLLFPVLLSSCASIKPEKPVETYSAAPVKFESSVINIPMDVPVSDIEKMVNNQVKGLLYEDNDLNDNGGDNLMVKAWKKEDIKISLQDNILSYRVPLKLWIKAGWKVSKFGLTVSDYKEVEGEIALKFNTSLTLNPDWTLTTNTTSGGYDWLSTPVMKIGPVDLPITFIANLILKTNQKTLNKEIDKAISGNLDLKKEMGSLWKILQKPVKVNEAYQVWIKVLPQEISTTPFSGKAGRLKHTLGIKSVVKAAIGAEPQPEPDVPLPPLRVSDKLGDDFQLNLTTGISFTKANELLKQYLAGQTLTQGKYHILIREADLYGKDNKMIIHLNVSGSLKGDLYLEGIPYFNKDNESIQVKELDYELKTKNALARTGNWLFHSTLVNLIQKNLVFSLSDQLKQSRTLLSDNLKEYHLTPEFTLKGSIRDLSLGDISLTRESILALVTLKGNLRIEVKP